MIAVIRRTKIESIPAPAVAPVEVPKRGWRNLTNSVRGELAQFGRVDASDPMAMPEWRGRA